MGMDCEFKILMTSEEKQKASIQDLSYDFACRIIRLYQSLSDTSPVQSSISTHRPVNEYVMSKQAYRSGTSIGANVREAQHAQSDADFLSKIYIAYKEADETNYWLNLFHDNGIIGHDEFQSIIEDNNRILRILTSITKTTRQKIQNSKSHH